jgi:hypothetical protein
MTPELVHLEALADTPAEHRAYRKLGAVVGLVFLGLAGGVAGAGC